MAKKAEKEAQKLAKKEEREKAMMERVFLFDHLGASPWDFLCFRIGSITFIIWEHHLN